MRHHVFLSYSRRDTSTMQKIRDLLRTSDLDVWTDEGIETGTKSWKQAIEDAILHAGCVVCILSPDANKSQWVRAELEFAELHDKPIYLILARGDKRTSVPFGFATMQWVDVRDSEDFSAKVDELSEIIRQKLGTKLPQINQSDLLPAPFELCEVTPGTIRLMDFSEVGGTQGGSFEIDAFSIAKYPVTNAQYQVFVDDQLGYRDVQWWSYSPEAMQFRQSNPSPKETGYHGDDLPRTNVSWFDAIAYCNWLSERLSTKVVLPTEQQWQRAAQGDTPWLYPWGNELTPTKCNYGNQVGQTTSVTQYPDGVSQFGVADTVGNVWEWCLTRWRTDKVELSGGNRRVVRGGSWSSDETQVQVSYREKQPPNLRGKGIGFRYVISG